MRREMHFSYGSRCPMPEAEARETMITYRPANPAEFATEWTWQTTLDWAHDAAEWEPVEVIEERWVLVERKAYTMHATCSGVGCDADAAHWGLCEAHAREDDPGAFTDPEVAP